MKSEKYKDKEEKKPKLNLTQVKKDLVELEHKQYLDQVIPAITKVFIKHAEIKDEKTKRITYKSEFTKEEAERLANDIYDELGYHSHRRVFEMDDETYNNLKKYKDPNGKPYTDTISRFHFSIGRDRLIKQLASDDKNTITIKTLEKVLEEPLKHHAELLTTGVLEKEGLTDPEHMEVVKGAIDEIVEKYGLSKKKFNTKKIFDHGQLLGLYVRLAQEYGGNEKESEKEAAKKQTA